MTITQNPVLISLFPALSLLPWLILAVPIGGIVDRVNRRALLAYANIARIALGVALSLLVATHSVNITHLYLFVFFTGICEVTVDTTSQALIPRLLNEKNYERGNARLQISENIVGGFISAPLSSFLFAIASVVPILISSAGYAVAVILVLLIPFYALNISEDHISVDRQPFIDELKFGISYLVKHPVLRRLVLTTTSIGIFSSLSNATTLLFLIKELHMPQSLFGTIIMIQGIGGIIGAIVVPKITPRFGRGKIMAVSILSTTISIIFNGLSPNIYLFVALGIFTQCAIQGWNIVLMSTYQNVIPNDLYGRIHGARRTLVWGIMPIGSFFGGIVATHGLRLPFFIGGAVSSLIALANFRWLTTLNQEKLHADQ